MLRFHISSIINLRMRKYLLIHILIISFVFFLTPITRAKEEKPRINLRSSCRDLSLSQVSSLPYISIRSEEDWGFYAHSTIGHTYETKSINGDMVVTDNATGLMWHQNGSENYVILPLFHLNFKNAKRWVKKLNKKGYAGFYDWRLPTVEEASSLLESSKKNSGLYIDTVFNKNQSVIWTCDSYGWAGAWYVDFNYGIVIVDWEHITSSFYVRPVRNMK